MFRSHGASSQEELVDHLHSSSHASHPRVVDVMKRVDRAKYTRHDLGGSSYADQPLPISSAATISAPHMHAMALDLLITQLQDGNRALDVGSGSGYLTVCMAHLCNVLKNPRALVAGIEVDHNLVAFSVKNVEKAEPALSKCPNFILRCGDGWAGCPDLAPFDAIHIGAAAQQIPLDLLAQLTVGGQMMVPYGPPHFFQCLLVVTRLSAAPAEGKADESKGDGPGLRGKDGGHRKITDSEIQKLKEEHPRFLTAESIRCDPGDKLTKVDFLMKLFPNIEDDFAVQPRQKCALMVFNTYGVFGVESITSVAFVPLIKPTGGSGQQQPGSRDPDPNAPVQQPDEQQVAHRSFGGPQTSSRSAFYSVSESSFQNH